MALTPGEILCGASSLWEQKIPYVRGHLLQYQGQL